MKPIQIRVCLSPHAKAILEQWRRLAGRPEQQHAGFLLQRLMILYEKNPKALEDLGLIARCEHPALSAPLEAAVA